MALLTALSLQGHGVLVRSLSGADTSVCVGKHCVVASIVCAACTACSVVLCLDGFSLNTSDQVLRWSLSEQHCGQCSLSQATPTGLGQSQCLSHNTE
jgi:hypothetical protein